MESGGSRARAHGGTGSLFHGAQGGHSFLDAAEAGYADRADELCARAGITADDLRMRLEAAKCQTQRIHVYRQVEREGWPGARR